MDTTLDPVLDLKLALWVFLGLLPIDAAFLALNAIHLQALDGNAPAWLQNSVFSIHLELGLSEGAEYLQSALTALVVGLMARRLRAPILWVLCALNAWMALDNALALHERMGWRLGRNVFDGMTLGLNRPEDLGELIAFALIGTGFLILLALTWRTASPRARRIAAILSTAVAAAAFFGVGVDAFHSSPWARDFETLAATVEDGGESLMLSLGCALAVGCYAAGRPRRPATTTTLAEA